MTSSSRDDNKSITLGIGHVLALTQCLTVLCNTNGYRRWLKDYHKIELADLFLPGYRIVLDILLGQLISELSDNTNLNLTETDTLRRALFSSKDLLRIPNDSQKTILLKNILTTGSHVLQARDWQIMQSRLADLNDSIIRPLQEINPLVVTHEKLKRFKADTIVNSISIFLVYIFLNDTSRNAPHGFGLSCFSSEAGQSTRYTADAFYGYKYAVQYLWFALYKDASQSVIRQIHKADTWKAFDRYFELIQKQIVEPTERKLGTSLGFDVQVFLPKDSRVNLNALIENAPPGFKISQAEKLRELLLWYDITIIESSDKPFAGVSTFIPLLIGSAALHRTLHFDSPTKVLRFLHPQQDSRFVDISYAILIPLGSLYGLADYSGWIVFPDCCSNFGSTREMYRIAERHIRRYQRNNKIDLIETTITKNRLKSFLYDYRAGREDSH